MITGRSRSIGLGKEANWGTAVAPTFFYSATESIEEERGRLREEMVFGTRSRLPADPGRVRISGSISGIHARPDGLGHLLRAAIGVPVTTGSGPYEHVFTPSVNAFSADCALPPYSITVKRSPGMVQRYSGGQLSRLTLRQERDGVLTCDTDWLAKGVANVADTSMVLETGTRFRFRHLMVERNGVAFPYVEQVTFTLDNALETEEVFNQSDEISAVGFGGNSSIEVEMTLRFEDAPTYQDFAQNNAQPWAFTWEIGPNAKLAISVPRLNIERWSSPTSGAGRMTITVGGVAEYDGVAGHELQVTLTNAVESY